MRTLFGRRLLGALAVFFLLAAQEHLRAQALFPPVKVLGIQNGVFALDGTKQFVVFASYFGGLRDAIQQPTYLVQNLDRMSRGGIRGVRIFGTWWNDDSGNCVLASDPRPLIKANGFTNVDPLGPIAGVPNALPIPATVDGVAIYQPPGGYHNSVAGRFHFLLDQAYQKGLIVDLTFAVETVNGLWNLGDPVNSLAKFGGALQGLFNGIRTLSYNGPGGPQTGYQFMFVDVENESNLAVGCKPALSAAQLQQLRNYVKAGDSAKLVTASTAADQEPLPSWTAIGPAGLDIVSYHDPRNNVMVCGAGPFNWVTMTGPRISGHPCGYQGWLSAGLPGLTVPIYFGEPERHRYNPTSCNQNAVAPPPGCSDNYSASQFLSAVAQAKAAGAAAWTWHTEKLFRYQNNYAPPLSNVEVGFIVGLPGTLAPIFWPR